MNFFRPPEKLISSIKRQYAKSLGVATMLTLLVGATGFTNFDSKAAAYTSPNWNNTTNTWITSGTWHDCSGSVDNDAAHHSLNTSDTDAAHHMGMVCFGNQEAWSPSNTTPVISDVVSAVSQTPPTTTSTTSVSQPTSVANPIVQNPSPATVSTPNSSDPFSGAKLYVNPNNDPSVYVRTHAGTYNAQLMSKIANQPEVTWLGGWNTNIPNDVSNSMKAANSQGALPVFVVYNIPNRDCGGYSAGGINDASSYASWISQIANTIGSQKAVIILEPDAITLTDCLSNWQLSDRNAMLRNAISTFKSKGHIAVYLDAGHPNWLAPSDMANRLKAAGIDQADGFALNIANFYSNTDNASYGQQISSLVGGKHFLVDTGRNGSGPTPDAQWCNPSGRSLGMPPTVNTGNPLIDAYLWVKGPGGSDGYCNGGPSAGTFWPDYALGLAQRANW